MEGRIGRREGGREEGREAKRGKGANLIDHTPCNLSLRIHPAGNKTRPIQTQAPSVMAHVHYTTYCLMADNCCVPQTTSLRAG